MSFPIPKNAHIAYFEVKNSVLLTDYLFSNVNKSQNEILGLLKIGAVHINNKRVVQELLLKKGDVIRVHLFPKRYPSDQVDWKKHIVFDCPDFVVLNKPTKVPVPPTVDNLHENVLHAFSKYLNFPLYITQRLDRGTSGVLVFAKTKTFQSQYNKLLSENQLSKKYLALTEEKVPVGTHTHYLSEETKIPKEVSEVPKTGFKEVRLIVETSSPFSHSRKTYYESRIQLLTGRTHQIRAQLSFLKAPLMGDRTYGGKETASFTFESFALHSCELKFLDYNFSCAPPWHNTVF